MNRKILIDKKDNHTRIALLENDKLAEIFYYDNRNENILKNIYTGKVKNVRPGMNAVFVDIGKGKNAYLNYGEILNNDRIPYDSIKNGDEILVQVIKEPNEYKSYKVTMNITLPGKYVIMKPYGEGIHLSHKINNLMARDRLMELINGIEMDEGIVIRTEAQNVSNDVIIKEIDMLKTKWDKIKEFSKYKSCYSLIYKEPDPTQIAVRDLLSKSVEGLVVEDENEFNKLKEYIGENYEEYLSKIRLYHDKYYLFDLYKVNTAIKKAIQSQVWLKNGSSIIIQQTEALTVIDVNSAKFVGKQNFQETIFKVNKEAGLEIIRQIRLRNISGIIIIDFIDMKKNEYKDKLLQILKEEVKKDRIKTVVFGMTRLGLVEMTRKKVSESLLEKLSNKCRACNGTGKKIIDKQVSM